MRRSLRKRVLEFSKRLLSYIYYHERYVVYSGPVPLLVDQSDCPVIQRREYSSHILSLYHSVSRNGRYLEHQLRNRFRFGLRMYEYYVEDELAGMFWLNADGMRFIDEVGYVLQLPSGHGCLRDVFVMPTHRGRHIFQRMLSAAIRKYCPDIKTIWSVSHSNNNSSIRAHRNAGLTRIMEIRKTSIAKTVMYRSSPSSCVGKWSGYEYPRRFLVTGRRYSEYVHRNLC